MFRGREDVGALAKFDVAEAKSVPTFEHATIVLASITTAAARVIALPDARDLAGADLACLMIAIAAVDARRAWLRPCGARAP